MQIRQILVIVMSQAIEPRTIDDSDFAVLNGEKYIKMNKVVFSIMYI